MSDRCWGSVTGFHGDADSAGKCPWCDRKIGPMLPRPHLGRGYLTAIDEAYGHFYDPDYGYAYSIDPRRGP